MDLNRMFFRRKHRLVTKQDYISSKVVSFVLFVFLLKCLSLPEMFKYFIQLPMSQIKKFPEWDLV